MVAGAPIRLPICRRSALGIDVSAGMDCAAPAAPCRTEPFGGIALDMGRDWDAVFAARGGRGVPCGVTWRVGIRADAEGGCPCRRRSPDFDIRSSVDALVIMAVESG